MVLRCRCRSGPGTAAPVRSTRARPSDASPGNGWLGDPGGSAALPGTSSGVRCGSRRAVFEAMAAERGLEDINCARSTRGCLAPGAGARASGRSRGVVGSRNAPGTYLDAQADVLARDGCGDLLLGSAREGPVAGRSSAVHWAWRRCPGPSFGRAGARTRTWTAGVDVHRRGVHAPSRSCPAAGATVAPGAGRSGEIRCQRVGTACGGGPCVNQLTSRHAHRQRQSAPARLGSILVGRPKAPGGLPLLY